MKTLFVISLPLLALALSSCGAISLAKNTVSGAGKITSNSTKVVTGGIAKAAIGVGNATKATFGGIGKATSNSAKAIANLSSNPDRVKIVEVREEELKEIPLGKDRALAFEKELKQPSWSFVAPPTFTEPVLPVLPVLPEFNEADIDADMGGSLLPPKSQS